MLDLDFADKRFSDGKHFYRRLSIDEKSNSLYVGAMNRLYRLWIFNVNDTTNTETVGFSHIDKCYLIIHRT